AGEALGEEGAGGSPIDTGDPGAEGAVHGVAEQPLDRDGRQAVLAVRPRVLDLEAATARADVLLAGERRLALLQLGHDPVGSRLQRQRFRAGGGRLLPRPAMI